MSKQPVIVEVLPATGGKSIGVLTLNVAATLNSLDGEMVEILLESLGNWQNDDSITCVFINASGEKAFCAGGDVQELYKSSFENPGGPCTYAENFFEREYRMNYLLHTYQKPVICWGHGIVMGGGLGILAACSHRVVTASTRIAMPEVTIALFPDVGGSWFLNKMPGACGLFLALTAASINAADALYTGLADVFIGHENQTDVLSALQAIEWSDISEGVFENKAKLVSTVLAFFENRSETELAPSNIESHRELIDQLCASDDGRELIENILSVETEDKWLSRARDNLASGSPLAALWIHQQLVFSADYCLQQVFQSELQLATNIMRYPEFAEGVRALLIDKDRNPSWQYPDWQSVPEKVLSNFFVAPWEQNPLQDL